MDESEYRAEIARLQAIIDSWEALAYILEKRLDETLEILRTHRGSDHGT